MKVALVHDYIKEYGGAERVLEALHELFPDAPVFTTVYLPNYLGPHKDRFKKWDIRTSWLQKIPGKAKLISPFRLLAPWVFSRFDFSDYDLIITSATGAYAPNNVTKRSAKLVCYCHTPPRYLYGFATAREWKKNIIYRILGELANHFLRIIDAKSSDNVDYFIANSKNVAGRIKKFYRRDATVIYPPVEASSNIASSAQLIKEKLNAKNLDAERYYLTGGRLARAKHTELAIKASRELGFPLKIFGKGFVGYGEELEQIAKSKENSQIEFLGEVSDEEKLLLMKNAKAFIVSSEDEDFGITPVEAMSQGTAVIAYKSGGLVESVIDGKTGVLYEKNTVEGLKSAIYRFEKLSIKPADCIEQSKKFSKERFKTHIQLFISEIFKK